MILRNDSTCPVMAFAWDEGFGSTNDILVQAGKTAEVLGPRIPVEDGRVCHVQIDGVITVQDMPGNKRDSFMIASQAPVSLKHGRHGVVIRVAGEPQSIPEGIDCRALSQEPALA